MGCVGQLGQNILHVGLVLRDQGPFHPAFFGAAKGIERRAAKELHPRQHVERPLHPRAKGPFHRTAIRTGFRQDRWRKVEGQLGIPLKGLCHFGAGGFQQARDLVFILIGQELVVAQGHGLFQARVGNAVHHGAITLRQPLALIGDQVVLAEGDPFIQRFRQGDDIGCHHALGIFGVQHGPTAQFKRTQVPLDRGTVQGDRLLQAVQRQRDQPLLPRCAEDHHVRIDRIPQRRLRQIRGIKQRDVILQPCLKCERQPVVGHLELGITGKLTRDDLVRVHDRPRPPSARQAKRLGPGRDNKIAPDQRIRLTRCHTNGADVFGTVRNTAMDMYGTALLGKARHLHHPSALAINLRGLRQHGTDGHNAGPTDTGDHHVMRTIDRR